MKIYVVLEKRPRDRDMWPALYLNMENALRAVNRVSDVGVVDLHINPEVSAERFDAVLWEAG